MRGGWGGVAGRSGEEWGGGCCGVVLWGLLSQCNRESSDPVLKLSDGSGHVGSVTPI